jgi:hypothetical protein
MVTTCSQDLAKYIISFVKAATTKRPSISSFCLSRLALKWPDLTFVQNMPDEVDVYCIDLLRQNSHEITGTMPSLGQTIGSLTYFWVILVALSCDTKFLEWIPDSLVDVEKEHFLTHFSNILGIFFNISRL